MQEHWKLVEFETGNAAHAAAFRELNIEWLERYFRVEAKDEIALAAPEKIVADGGVIVLAESDAELLGCGALLKVDDSRYEIAKMAVTATAQGLGIGRAILVELIRRFEALDGTELFLESNSGLLPALALYRSVGFEQRPHPFRSEYARADVYMIWRGWTPENQR